MKFKKYIIVVTIFIVMILTISISLLKCSPEPIKDYNPKRDYQNIVQNFKDDNFWLVEEGLNLDFDYILNTHSPNKHPQYKGKLKIKVLLDHGKFAGFITYYKKSYYRGFIQFLSVSKNFRGKGYGKKLVQYAIKDLFSMGCTQIGITTRLINKWARNIYTSLGFKETGHDEIFIDYAIARSQAPA